jgi:O-antigen/teichoic acid export membrane protein
MGARWGLGRDRAALGRARSPGITVSDAETRNSLAELLAGTRAGERAVRMRAAIAGRSLLRNSVFIMLTTGISSALGYVFWVIVARSFPADQIGVAAALITAMMLIAAIAEAGTTRSLVQRLPRQPDDVSWSRTLTASALTGVVAGLAVALVAAIVILPDLSPRLEVVGSSPAHAIIFAVGVGAWSLSQIADHVFIAERQSGKMVARNLVFGIVKIPIVVAAAAALGHTAMVIFGSWVAGMAAGLVLAYALMVTRLSRRYRPTMSGVAEELRALTSTFAGNYLINLGGVLPSFLLPIIVLTQLSATDNAYFYVTWLLGGAFFTISFSVAMALFAEGAHDPRRIAEQTRSAVKIIGLLLAPVMLVFFLAGTQILEVFGSAYATNGDTLLILLTASAIPDAITNIFVARMRALEQLRIPAVLNLSMAAVTIGGTFLLLDPMGLAGVGVAWISAQTAGSLFVIGYAIAWRRRRPAEGVA